MSGTAAMNGDRGQRTLLLAPPSLASKEDKFEDVYTTFDRQTSDLQMLDRLSAGFVVPPKNTYDAVVLLTDTESSIPSDPIRLITRHIYSLLVPAMKAGATLRVQNGSFDAVETREAILAGLTEQNGGFIKATNHPTTAVPLKFGSKNKAQLESRPNGLIHGIDDGKDEDEDELIDEDTLLSDDDLQTPMPPPECQPKVGRRRRACKDCTCGLAAKIEAEDKARQEKAGSDLEVLKLQSDDLVEADFTVQGKTGSCGNCALGDAFRCAGCPYVGLPPFKPGQEVQILNDVAQL